MSKQKTADFQPENSVQSISKRKAGQVVLSAILSIIANAFGLVPSIAVYLITQHFFIHSIADANISYIIKIILFTLISVGIKSAAMAFSLHTSHIAAYDILYEIRIELAKKLSTLSLGWFDNRNTGAIKRIIHENVEKMESALAHAIPELASAISIPLMSIAILLFIDWRMALILLVAPAIGLIFFLIMQYMNVEILKKYYELVDKMNSMIIQYINGMKIIKAFTQAKSSFKDLKDVVDEMADYFIFMGEKAQTVFAGMNVAFRSAPLFILPIGLIFYQQELITLPKFILFLLMSLSFARPIYNFLMRGSMAFYEIIMSMKRIDTLFQEPSLEEPQNPKNTDQYDIAFNDVSFTYASSFSKEQAATNHELILENLNLTIPEGKIVALVGPSGAGKTTIARLIPRFWDVTSGSITIGGIDVKDYSFKELMNKISFVFQDVFLFNDSIYENIKIGNPNATHQEVMQAAQRARCDQFAQELGGYDYIVGENGSRLSGGQRQRISIARAILKNAPIIVLDEATAFIDPENEGLIQEALAALIKSDQSTPKTLIVVAHRLSTITEVDQIYLINQGKIQAQGTHQNLLANSPLYKSLWDAHTNAQDWQFDNKNVTKKIAINRNTTYDEPYQPLPSDYENLKTAKSHWQRIKALISGEKHHLKKGIIASFFEGLFVGQPVLILYIAILSIFNQTLSTKNVIILTASLFIVYIVQAILNRTSYMAFMRLDTNIQKNLRLYLSDYLRRLPLGFFSKRDVGYIDALFTSTIDFIETRFSIVLFIQAIITPALIFIFTLFIDWRMALAMIISVPIAGILLNKSFEIFTIVWRAQREALKTANARMVEYIQGISVIRAFNLSGKRFKNFDVAMDEYRKASKHTTTKLTPATLGFSTILEFGFVIVLAVGVWLSLNGSLPFDRYLIFLLLGTSFYAPIMGMADMIGIQRITANGVDNINEFIKTPILPESVHPQLPQGHHISFKNVDFSYENEKVLDNISFEVPENTMLALVGPSGSGKTTITNLIARFWDADQGQIEVGGINVKDMTTDALLSKITMVFQDVYLFNDTIYNNIKFANPAATEEQVKEAARLAQAHHFIEEFPQAYQTIVGEGGSTLSGGQKQRISIARAILKDAPIILLDEATSSIDPENERLLQKAFNALVGQKTVIIIAHKLNTIQAADNIIVLDKGEIIQQGQHQQLIDQKGMYQYFWEEQQKARVWKI